MQLSKKVEMKTMYDVYKSFSKTGYGSIKCINKYLLDLNSFLSNSVFLSRVENNYAGIKVYYMTVIIH